MDFLSAINKGFDFCPPLARCRLLNKSSLQSTRLIIRKPKIDSAKNKVQTEIRLLLEYAAKKFFPEKVDVRGMFAKHMILCTIMLVSKVTPIFSNVVLVTIYYCLEAKLSSSNNHYFFLAPIFTFRKQEFAIKPRQSHKLSPIQNFKLLLCKTQFCESTNFCFASSP